MYDTTKPLSPRTLRPNANDDGPLREQERTRCEIWTRVMGYHRPVSAFNPGKQAEHAERLCFQQRGTAHDRTSR